MSSPRPALVTPATTWVKDANVARSAITPRVPEAVQRLPVLGGDGLADVEVAGVEDKIRSRYARPWSLVASAIALIDEATVFDNSSASEPFRVVASFDRGAAVSKPGWPRRAPKELRVAI